MIKFWTYIGVSILILSTSGLTGCATSTPGTSPTLSPDTRPTSRLPSPGNPNATAQMQSKLMAPPSY
ncbi:MAG TPA: hypothetical protein VHZ76_10115 [Gammaproteobacteria bacterium]|jgi:hypothetical protein|nr:hypothetical protein [Gammaproteobacteria bacterium]